MEEIFEKDELEVKEQLEKLEKQRDKDNLVLSKLDEEQMVDLLVNVYKSNEETLKKGEFSVIDGGEL